MGTETPANRAIIAMVTFLPFSEPTVALSVGELRSQKAIAAGPGHPFTLPESPPMS
ncbi:hypothetical protein TPA0907_25940 [Micromonospora humidisoli]|nr:hypothetical protein TPA0907_25940 [Micromonospora sp. AKA109]